MAPLFWIDVAALAVCAMGSSALGIMVLSLGPDRPSNRMFALYAGINAAWVLLTLALRLSLWLGVGNPQLLLELTTIALCLAGPALLLFAGRYTRAAGRCGDAVALASLVISLVLSVPLLQHRLVLAPRLTASGVTVAQVTPLAALIAIVPLAPMLFAFALFWRQRADTGERLLAASAATLAGGFVAGGVLQTPLPVLSITNTAGVLLLGYAIVRNQLMNPLRELTNDLERKVLERSRDLERAYSEVEQRVAERTAQLEQEIAERRRTEEVLRESEEKFRNLADQSPNMIFINTGGKVVYANRMCEEVMGYSREEFYAPGFSFFSIMAPESMDTISASFSRHSLGEDVAPYEYSLVTRGGRRLEVLIASKLIRYEGQSAILGIITDISARKRTERLLAGVNDVAIGLTRALTPEEGLAQAASSLESLGFFSSVHLMSDDRTGLELRRFGGENPATSIYQPAARLSLAPGSIARRVLDDQRVVVLPAAQVPQLAPPRMSRLVLAPLLFEHEAVGLLTVTSADLSDDDLPTITAYANLVVASWRKTRLVQELEDSLEQLRRAQAQLVQSQKMEAIGRLAGGLAHDFNNILTAITGYTDLVIASAPPALREDLNEIRQAAGRASALTRQLLAFSRKQVLQPKTIDLNTVVSGMDKMLRRLIPEDIEVSTVLASGLGNVRADPGQIEQVVLNLALNARDAMPDGGRLTIETAAVELDESYARGRPGVTAGRYVLLAVTDTGVGMDARTQEHLFEPFFTTKSPGTGTGLGLSTVYGIVRQSDGHISVYSESGHGSTFKIYLPSLSAATAEERAEHEAPAPGGGSETILVVEDEPVLRNLVRRLLGRSGYNVLVAADADEAIEASDAHSSPIDLLLTDVVMPGRMNGRDLARLLSSRRPQMRVLYMSGYAENAIVHHGVLDPAVAFLPKPFNPSTLIAKVQSVLREPPHP